MFTLLKRPRTTAEARRNSQPEEQEFVRAKRRSHNLPNAWDDCPIYIAAHTCWKRTRKTQYRPK
jgi:hypothetical protein